MTTATNKAPLKLLPLPFEEAIAHSLKRGITLPEIYYGKMQGIERAEAFSVAGIAALDQLQQTLDSLTGALAEGVTFKTWKEEILKAPDVLDLPAHRLDNIFRTNIQGAYARGHCVHIERNKERRPFLMYSAINDGRTRPHHMAMNGHVAPIDDPIWQTWTAPCGYRCRCTVISLTEEQAAQRMEQDRKRLDRDNVAAMDRAKAIAGGPDQGWDYSPCSATTTKPEGIAPHTEPGIVEAIRKKRHPSLTQHAEALLAAFLAMLGSAADEEGDQK